MVPTTTQHNSRTLYIAYGGSMTNAKPMSIIPNPLLIGQSYWSDCVHTNSDFL
ncbi:hypothetical protein YC2023_094572 [Brassica napus]